MKVIITYHNDTEGLVASLISFQSQTVLPDEIIIIDTSKEKTAPKIVSRFNFNLLPVTVICSGVNIYKAWNLGIKKAGNSNVLIANDDLIVPFDLIERFNKTLKTTNTYALVPNSVNRTFYSEKIEMKFLTKSKNKIRIEKADWMVGFCFVLTKKCIKDVGLFDENFSIWFGDTDYERRIINKSIEYKMDGIIRDENTFVYHFGGKSYKYKNNKTQKIINKDRDYFISKYKDGFLKSKFKTAKMIVKEVISKNLNKNYVNTLKIIICEK